MRRTHGLALALVALALTACAGGPSFGLDAGAATATVLRGDELTRTVTVARGGVAGPIALGASGAPSGVAVTFAEAVLPDGATSTTMTIAVDPAAVDGTADLTITAVAGSRAASTALSIAVESLTVTGRTVDEVGLPLPGVAIGIQGSTTVSGTDGAFELSGIAVPYDVATYFVGPDPVAHVFVGLRADDVTLFPLAALSAPSPASTTVSGALPAVVPADHLAHVCVEGLGAPLFGCDTLVAGAANYEVVLDYAGGTLDARVHAILVEVDADGRPVTYPSYGTAETTVTAGGTSSNVDIASPTNPGETSITLGANVPAGFDASNAILGVQLGSDFTLALGGATIVGGVLGPFPVPVLPGASYGVAVAAYAASGAASTIGWRFGLAPGASATFDLAAPPVQQTPADGATGVGVGSTLVLATPPNGIATYVISPSVAGPQLAITTVEDRVTIPDLTYLGFALAAAAEHTWAVIVAPGSDTPEAGGSDWIGPYAAATYALSVGGPTPSETTGTIFTTGSRSFFTP